MALSKMMQDWKDSGLRATSINLTVFRVAWRLGYNAGRREVAMNDDDTREHSPANDQGKA